MGRSNCEGDDGTPPSAPALRKPAATAPRPLPARKPPVPTPFAAATSRSSANALSSPAEHALLIQRITAILRSSECSLMNFMIGPYLVTGLGYATVARAIAAGTIAIAVGEASGHEASYSPATRTLTLPRVNYGTFRGERGSIVHEATHAMIDIHWGANAANGSDLTAPVEEPIAYIAESVFRELNERSGFSAMGPAQSHPAGEIQRQAALIGTRIALELIHSKNRLLKPMPRVDQAELNLVSRAVAAHPEYQ